MSQQFPAEREKKRKVLLEAVESVRAVLAGVYGEKGS